MHTLSGYEVALICIVFFEPCARDDISIFIKGVSDDTFKNPHVGYGIIRNALAEVSFGRIYYLYR